MKKNYYEAFDQLRNGKFKSTQKIKDVENILKTDNIVINWWCRQSGKSLTNVKISRDVALNNQSNIYIISRSLSSGADLLAKIKRSIPNELIIVSLTYTLTLNNGSCIRCVSAEMFRSVVRNADVMIVDEFDFIEKTNFMQGCLEINKVLFGKTLLSKLFSKFFKRRVMKIVFSSSKNDGENFKLIRKIFQTAKVTFMNWENIPHFDNDHVLKLLGEKKFKLEYDSYSSLENL